MGSCGDEPKRGTSWVAVGITKSVMSMGFLDTESKDLLDRESSYLLDRESSHFLDGESKGFVGKF